MKNWGVLGTFFNSRDKKELETVCNIRKWDMFKDTRNKRKESWGSGNWEKTEVD